MSRLFDVVEALLNAPETGFEDQRRGTSADSCLYPAIETATRASQNQRSAYPKWEPEGMHGMVS